MDFGKQIGPLPLGAWIAVVGTGVGVAVWARGTGTGTVTDTSTDAVPVDEWSSVGTGVNGQWTDVTPPVAPSPDEVASVAGPVTDNNQWGQVAIQWLIASGYDPAMAQSAITKALQEQRLSVREYALWWVALRQFGPPPDGVNVKVPTGQKPVTPPKPTPPKPRDPPPARGLKTPAWYTTHPGDTLKRIARRFYNDESKWHRIYEANREGVARPGHTAGWITHPNGVLPPGRHLYIPKG